MHETLGSELHKNKIKVLCPPTTQEKITWEKKDLGIRPKTLQLLEENVGPTLQHMDSGTDFFNKTPKA